jgi:hypothetical protein
LRQSAGLKLKIEYLREYEFTFKAALAHEPGDPGVLFDEKTEGRKSCETVPLNTVNNLNPQLFLSSVN